jgi:hypothetical protein
MKKKIKNSLDIADHDIKAGDFKEEFTTDSGKIAIIDAALLDGIDNPLVRSAIVIGTKFKDVTFSVNGQFDNSILRKLEICPKSDQNGAVVGVTQDNDGDGDADRVIPQEGIMPFSNDDSIQQRMRAKTGGSGGIRSKRKQKAHMAGDDSKYDKDPTRRVRAMRKDGNRKKNRVSREGINQIYAFMSENAKKRIASEDLRGIEDKVLLKAVLDKMYAMSLSGWEAKDGVLEHSTGIQVCNESWTISDGLLYNSRNGSRPNIDFDWVYTAREALKEFIIEENKAVDVDNLLEEFKKNAGRTLSG